MSHLSSGYLSRWLLVCGSLVGTAVAAEYGCFWYDVEGDHITIKKCLESTTGIVEVPAKIEGKPVTTIRASSFQFCTEITGVKLPATLTSIGDGAFRTCSKMAFINIPEGVTTFEASTFAGCSSLKSIAVPETLTQVASYTFAGCNALASVELPDSVTRIGYDAFFGCTSLTEIRLPAALEIIDAYAFESCYKLARVKIPAGVTSLGKRSFVSCFSLEEMVFKGNAPAIGEEAFGLTNANLVIKFYNGRTGFTTPLWYDKTCVNAGDEPFPEISVRQAGKELADGGAGKNLGPTVVGEASSTIFTIANTGGEELTGLAISKEGMNAEDFTVFASNNHIINPGDSTTFIVDFRPGALGTRTATLHIASDDPDEDPYDLVLTGSGVLPQPEITVEHPAGSRLVDGKARKSFGTVMISRKGPTKTFTIKNTGARKLSGLSVSLKGGNAGDFILTQPGMTSLAPGAGTSFKVAFRPTAKGDRTTMLRIKSNDADESPFEIKLSGMGAR